MMALVARILAVSYPGTMPSRYGVPHEDNLRVRLSLFLPATEIISNRCAAAAGIFVDQKNKSLHKFWDSGLKVAPRANPG